MKYTGLLAGLILLLLISGCQTEKNSKAITEESENIAFMLLAMYHFSNPGLDKYNTEVDDYHSDTRQEQIEEVVNSLSEFRPTKILVEVESNSQDKIDSLYQLYLNDKIHLSGIKRGVDETYQIGFRLGKKLKGIDIIAVDHPGNWLGPYADFIADTLKLEFYKKNTEESIKVHEAQENMFKESTIRENLIHTNSWEQILRNHDYYNNVAIKVKDSTGIMFSYQQMEQEIEGLPYLMRSFDFNNIGVELVTEWYKRNLFIYRNILEVCERDDRVLLIIGQGHARYLHQLLGDNSAFELVSPIEYLE